jgi:hypothetical protein
MHHVLRLHPDSRCLAAARVEVTVARPRPDHLVLSYIVTGKISDVRMPPVVPAPRADELWRHTCFEAFVRAASGPSYYEFNFAPSTQWAAYRFDSYRNGMRVAAEIDAPQIEVRSSPDSYTLQASLELDRLPDLSRQGSWRLGLSALIEDRSGGMSYWALAHPPGKPDFHHADSFALEFAPAVQP